MLSNLKRRQIPNLCHTINGHEENYSASESSLKLFCGAVEVDPR